MRTRWTAPPPCVRGYDDPSYGLDYEMIIVPNRAARIAEQLGSRDKYWFIGDDGITPYLFKLGRPDTGEHWAEVVVARIADSLEIPHARYDLASDGRSALLRLPSLHRTMRHG